MNTKDMIEVMTAYTDGLEIEFMRKTDPLHGWCNANIPSWDWYRYDYRIKSSPRTVYVNLYANGELGGAYYDKDKARNASSTIVRTLKFVEVGEEKYD